MDCRARKYGKLVFLKNYAYIYGDVDDIYELRMNVYDVSIGSEVKHGNDLLLVFFIIHTYQVFCFFISFIFLSVELLYYPFESYNCELLLFFF